MKIGGDVALVKVIGNPKFQIQIPKIAYFTGAQSFEICKKVT